MPDEIRSEHWRMYVGGELVGLLHTVIPDQPWITCTFEPLEDWKGVRLLFDVQNQAAKERFPADKVWATKGFVTAEWSYVHRKAEPAR
ncbi:hypothetical protein ACFQ77_10000 [Streptomyces virginiae]|uniref:hypothetical protein n=1 Tax=Streptomyces virginiae TaxID=1961 RepID=UPI0036CE0C23